MRADTLFLESGSFGSRTRSAGDRSGDGACWAVEEKGGDTTAGGVVADLLLCGAVVTEDEVPVFAEQTKPEEKEEASTLDEEAPTTNSSSSGGVPAAVTAVGVVIIRRIARPPPRGGEPATRPSFVTTKADEVEAVQAAAAVAFAATDQSRGLWRGILPRRLLYFCTDIMLVYSATVPVTACSTVGVVRTRTDSYCT